MPPQISDEGSVSDVSQQENKREVKRGGSNVNSEPEEELKVESDEGNNEEQGEDEFVVEKILKHAIDEEGVLRFQVKEFGNCPRYSQTHILKVLVVRIDLWIYINEKKAEAAEAADKKQGKKRGRPSAAGTPQTNGKKSRKNGHPSSSTPPASLEPFQFKPPSGSWEDDVVTIEAMEGPNAEVIVYLTWKGGYKSQHPLHQVYKRCPQKVFMKDIFFLKRLKRTHKLTIPSSSTSTSPTSSSLSHCDSLRLRASGYLVHAEGDLPSLGFGCYSTSGAVCTFIKLVSKTNGNEKVNQSVLIIGVEF
ncbi:hypothetical protein DID88_008074 [Monilinia fructigena]|uniref:Chromo shadow domain-containing protein n=1 Tax=Monilinia fructigena TaxID=38457 RepID=A0A395J493_9HELO|nr:hypothetical protein DID88_008074 [Monilinia fructigena]